MAQGADGSYTWAGGLVATRRHFCRGLIDRYTQHGCWLVTIMAGRAARALNLFLAKMCFFKLVRP